jgi:hypothetical protein
LAAWIFSFEQPRVKLPGKQLLGLWPQVGSPALPDTGQTAKKAHECGRIRGGYFVGKEKKLLPVYTGRSW